MAASGLRRWALGSIALVACNPAYAQTAADTRTGVPPVEEQEIVVTGRYSVDAVATGTKTDTPLIEIPQSIAVVTEALIEERRPLTLTEALYNVSGVSDSGSRRGFDNILIRGFTASTSIYLDGLRVERGNFLIQQEPFGFERIEVLKGPGSVLFGQGSLGGIINSVSKRPTSDPRYSIDLSGGSFGTYQGAVDIGGPIGGGAGFRLNALYRDLGDSIDFNDKTRIYVSPVVGWTDGDTTLTALANYTRDRHQGAYVGVSPEGVFLPNVNGRIDRSRYIGEPANDRVKIDRYTIGYEIEQRVSDAVRVRQNLRYTDTDAVSAATFASGLNADQRTLRRGTALFQQNDKSAAIDSNIEWKFGLAGFQNTLLAGVDLFFQEVDQTFDFGGFPPIDLFAPVYGGARSPLFPVLDFNRTDKLYGFYIQNQLKVGERLTVLLGGRYDLADTDNFNVRNGRRTDQKDSDFTFRGGAVYQFTPGVGIYASYSEAFNPNFGNNGQTGDPFAPEIGEQYEAGIKTDLAGGRVRATLAAYQLTRDNVIVGFPGFPGLQIQTGQQRSRGVEADLAVRLTRAWDLTAAYAYTDVFVRRDTNPLLLGDTPINAPEHQASLWTTYDIDVGGNDFTLGVGGRYVGKRQGTLPNSFTLPKHGIVDAAITYRLDRLRFQLNAYNLFDKNYVDSASPTGARTMLLGEPVTVRGSIAYTF